MQGVSFTKKLTSGIGMNYRILIVLPLNSNFTMLKEMLQTRSFQFHFFNSNALIHTPQVVKVLCRVSAVLYNVGTFSACSEFTGGCNPHSAGGEGV